MCPKETSTILIYSIHKSTKKDILRLLTLKPEQAIFWPFPAAACPGKKTRHPGIENAEPIGHDRNWKLMTESIIFHYALGEPFNVYDQWAVGSGTDTQKDRAPRLHCSVLLEAAIKQRTIIVGPRDQT